MKALVEKGAQMRVIIRGLRKRMAEQAALVDKLERIARLLELGVDPEQIASYALAGADGADVSLTMRDGSKRRLVGAIGLFPVPNRREL